MGSFEDEKVAESAEKTRAEKRDEAFSQTLKRIKEDRHAAVVSRGADHQAMTDAGPAPLFGVVRCEDIAPKRNPVAFKRACCRRRRWPVW